MHSVKYTACNNNFLFLNSSPSQPAVTITFHPLIIKTSLTIHFYCSSHCKFPEYNLKLALCSTVTVLCAPGTATWRATPAEYCESSPELATVSGTGSTLREQILRRTDTTTLTQSEFTKPKEQRSPEQPSGPPPAVHTSCGYVQRAVISCFWLKH